MKHLLSKTGSLASLVALSVVSSVALTSCKKDYYDADYMRTISRNAFPISAERIDPNHTWETVARRQASIRVGLGLSPTYQLSLYTDEPLHSGTQALLLARAQVREGETVTVDFDAPSVLTQLFVAVTDGEGHAVAAQAPIGNDGVAVFDIGAASTRATEAEAPNYAATCQDYLGSLNDADMRQYAAFTDADIDVNNTFTNGQTDWNTGVTTYTVGDGHHFRVAAGTTVTKVFHLNANWGATDNVVVYVEGTLHLNGNNLNGPTLVVAPTGHVIIDGNTSLTNTGRFVVEEGGRVTASSGVSLSVTNGQRCYNAGTVNIPGTLVLNGSDFYNCGTVQVGSLENTSYGGKITNFGSIVVNNNQIQDNAYNCTFINASYLNYTGNAGVGNLTQLPGAYLKVDGQLTLTGTCTLGDKSLVTGNELVVSGTTFNGPTGAGQYAVLQVRDKLHGGWADAWNLNGVIYVDWNPIGVYVNGQWSEDNGPYSVLTGLKSHVAYWANGQTTAITIPASSFSVSGNEGFEPETAASLPTDAQTYTYAFEDMTTVAGDYDFNDCVFTVTAPLDGKLTLTLWATGATKTLDLCLKLTKGNTDNVRTLIHDLTRVFLDGEGKASDGWIINTEMGPKVVNERYYSPVVIEVTDLPEGFSIAENGDFFIADSYGQVHIPAFTEGFQPGDTPYALRVPTTWAWPIEQMPITSVYSGFSTWAQDATKETEWYKAGFAEGYVFDKSLLPSGK